MRRNTYDAASGAVTVSQERAEAIRAVAGHYQALFGNDPSLATLRDQYAMMDATVPKRPTARR